VSIERRRREFRVQRKSGDRVASPRPHPPQFDQRGLIVAIVHLQANAVCLFYDRADCAVNNPACVQREGDAVTGLELVVAV